MDIQRTLLIGVIFLLSFMLLVEWTQFSSERSQPDATQRLTKSTAAGPELDTPQSLPAAFDEVPVQTNNTGADDVPEITEQAPSRLSPAADETSSRNIVKVFTDTLHIAIDLDGGDIVEVALPKFLAEIDDPTTPFLLLETSPARTYVAQSGLIGPDGIDGKQRALFTSTQSVFRMEAGEPLIVDLAWAESSDVRIIKRFSFTPDSYVVDVTYLVENTGSERWQGNLFGQIKRDSSPAPQSDTSGMGMQPFLGAATTTADDRFKKFDFDDMRKEPFQQQFQGGWIAMIQHYFLSAWIPNPEQTNRYSTRVTSAGFNIAGFTAPALVVDPGETGETGASFYAGPKDQYSLKEISPYLDLSVDYGWLWWIGVPLFWLLTKIHALVGNWGVAIILLTVLIKAIFFRLSATSYRSMANMRKLQPKVQDLREQYADDKQKQSQAMMELYKKEKVNPMGGCLPILLQMPVFIALYWVLMESVELRQAPFALWIEDLSVMDPYFVLPILMGGSMWFMQKLNPPPPDPMQAKIMQWLPIVFTFFFLWFPAGLVLYWVVNNLLSMAQQYVITRQIEAASS
ncbi:MAG: membrane protein insertase YidC [Pseudomonadota bacterium]